MGSLKKLFRTFVTTIFLALAISSCVDDNQASDPEEAPLLFLILEGNLDDAFVINPDGVVTVANTAAIDFETYPVFNLVIRVSDNIDESILKLRVIIRDDEEEDLRPLTDDELAVMDYFTDIALGFEFGNASQITRKWKDTMHVFVNGDTTVALLDELNMIIEELNDLITDDFYISRVGTRAAANMHVYLGRGTDYATLYPSASNFVGSNFGLFFINFDNNNYLTNAHMYVDTYRANRQAQRHLLREEFTQSLGLARDSNKHEGSIFTQRWTTTTDYIDIDRDVISLLYHPKMRTGLNEQEVRKLMASILREG